MNNFTLGSVKLETLFVPLAIRSSTKSGCQAKGNAIEDALIINQCDLTIRSMRVSIPVDKLANQ